MTLDPEHKKTLEVLERVVKAGKLQESCSHGAEPDFCDNCAVERDRDRAAALKVARARLRECGIAVSVG